MYEPYFKCSIATLLAIAMLHSTARERLEHVRICEPLVVTPSTLSSAISCLEDRLCSRREIQVEILDNVRRMEPWGEEAPMGGGTA